MRVTISSSATNDIDSIYIEKSKELLEYLASNGFDLNWGSGSISIMGLCYDIFSKYNRNIYGYTTPKYLYDLDNLPNATHKTFEDTLELKRNIFKDADLYICMPGGLGSISEFFAFLEEARSNDNPTPIVLYNINNHFDSTIKLLDDLEERRFDKPYIKNFFKVINNLEEFKDYYNNIKN